SSRLPIRERTFGSTNRAPGRAWCSMRLRLTAGSAKNAEKILSLRSPRAPRFLSFLHPALWYRHRRQQLVHDRIGRDAFRLRAEVRQHAVAQHRVRECADVVEAHVIAAAG